MRNTLMFIGALMFLTLAASAADGSIPNRMDKVKAGEWVMMLNVSGAEAGEKIKVSVAEVKDGAVVIKRETFNADGSSGEVEQREIALSRYNERLSELEGKAKQISRERLTVKDKELSVVAVTWDREAEGETHEFKIWVSEELPIGGIAKTWSSDQEFPAAEVIDYGFAQ